MHGIKNGVIRQLEMFIGFPLHVHMLAHVCNILMSHHLIQHLDGKTNCTRGFFVAIGKMLEYCEKL